MISSNDSAVDAQQQERTTQYTPQTKFGSNAQTPVIFSFRLNDKDVKNKEHLNETHLSKNWKQEEGTVKNLANYIKQGYAFMPGMLNETGHRCSKNVIGYQSVAVDIDSKMSLQEALEHPFVKQYCGLIYTSFTHQKEKTTPIVVIAPKNRKHTQLFKRRG